MLITPHQIYLMHSVLNYQIITRYLLNIFPITGMISMCLITLKDIIN